MATLSISIPAELAEMIDEKIASGMYHSASEVIGESLMLFRDHDELRRIRLERLRKDLASAIKQVENGDVIKFTSGKEYAEKIKAEGRRIMADRRKE